MNYHLSKNIVANDAQRAAFNALATRSFGISFENWYREGYWTDAYRPYTLFDGERAVANVSVNRLDLRYQGESRRYIQLGGVMTDEAYRRQGLSRYLMEEVKRDWASRCDCIFLFANSSVLDFYPRLGFERGQQYLFDLPLERVPAAPRARRLDMDAPADREVLRACYQKGDPFSRLQAVNGFPLLMFYCLGIRKDCVYYVQQYDAAVIAKQNGPVLDCYDVYCDAGAPLPQLLSAVAAHETQTVSLKFTPLHSLGVPAVPYMDDTNDRLFVLVGMENLFKTDKLLFPPISHT